MGALSFRTWPTRGTRTRTSTDLDTMAVLKCPIWRPRTASSKRRSTGPATLRVHLTGLASRPEGPRLSLLRHFGALSSGSLLSLPSFGKRATVCSQASTSDDGPYTVPTLGLSIHSATAVSTPCHAPELAETHMYPPPSAKQAHEETVGQGWGTQLLPSQAVTHGLPWRVREFPSCLTRL